MAKKERYFSRGGGYHPSPRHPVHPVAPVAPVHPVAPVAPVVPVAPRRTYHGGSRAATAGVAHSPSRRLSLWRKLYYLEYLRRVYAK